jgi:hypothetical protein
MMMHNVQNVIVTLETLFTSAKYVNDISVWILFMLKMTASLSEHKLKSSYWLHATSLSSSNPPPTKHRERGEVVIENVLLICINTVRQLQIYRLT